MSKIHINHRLKKEFVQVELILSNHLTFLRSLLKRVLMGKNVTNVNVSNLLVTRRFVSIEGSEIWYCSILNCSMLFNGFLFCDKSPEKVLACFDMIKLLFFLLIFWYITIVSVLVSTRELFIFARRFTIIDFWVIISFSRPLPYHNIPFPYLAESSVELF